MSRGKLLITGAVAVLLIGAAVFAYLRAADEPEVRGAASGPEAAAAADAAAWTPGTRPPKAAGVTMQRLSTLDARVRRSALSPDFAAIVERVKAPPHGGKFVLDADGWRGDGRFAAATAALLMPGHPTELFVVGFEKTRASWLITFLEPR